jgi:hypothetical protein
MTLKVCLYCKLPKVKNKKQFPTTGNWSRSITKDSHSPTLGRKHFWVKLGGEAF